MFVEHPVMVENENTGKQDVCRTSCYCREWKETNTEEMELFILFPLKAVSG